MNYFKKMFAVFLMVLVPWVVNGEEIANYSDCDVCNGAIHLTVEETKELLGFKAVMVTMKIPLPTDKMVKIDLDGELEMGTRETPDDGYEIKIWGSEIFFIQDLRDMSTIQMITSRAQLTSSGNAEGYAPHIYLDAGHDFGILLTDSVDEAWAKMQQTYIYQWVGETRDKQAWLALLRKKIFEAMVLMSPEQGP